MIDDLEDSLPFLVWIAPAQDALSDAAVQGLLLGRDEASVGRLMHAVV